MIITGKNRPLNFSIDAPASKSVYHRELIIRFLLGDTACLSELPDDNEDVLATKACLKALASAAKENAATDGMTDTATDGMFDTTNNRTSDCESAAKYEGEPAGESDCKQVLLPCNESGSTLRFMIPVACAYLLREGLNLSVKELIFSTKGRLFDRPITELSDALAPHGIQISKEEADRTIHVVGTMTPDRYTIDGSVSSQYISGLLMALPLFDSKCEIEVTGELKSVHYIGLTLDALEKYQCKTTVQGQSFFPKPSGYTTASASGALAGDFSVEGDWSNGAFLLCLKEFSEISVGNLNPDSRQGDKGILPFLEAVSATRKEKGSDLLGKGSTWDCNDIPDITPYMAIVAAFVFEKTTFLGVSRLRIKESDRVAAIRKMLDAVNIKTEETHDSLTVYGSPASVISSGLTKPVSLSSYHDHRMAMCAILLTVILGTDADIDDVNCLKKSFPEFLNTYLPKYFS